MGPYRKPHKPWTPDIPLTRHPHYTPPPFGQHFLHDRNMLSLIVDAAELSSDDVVLEIGVGTGRLTRAILNTGASVIGVEVDSSLIASIEAEIGPEERFRLVKGDILHLPWADLLPEGRRAVLMGNLPYAVSTQILFMALGWRERIGRAVFLVQWEVGRRIAAPPGGKDYGILAVLCQLYGRTRLVRKVPPGVFLPPPRVDSALVRWDISVEPLFPLDSEAFTLKVVKAAFGQRRKKLANSLASGFPEPGRPAIASVIESMGLGESVRAEQLTVEQFARLANLLGRLERGGDLERIQDPRSKVQGKTERGER